MKKGYIAKPLFKEGDVRESIRVGEVVRAELPEIDFYNPAENDEINDKEASLPTPREIFIADTERIIESDVILAELDGEDPGVVYEIGLAHGLNIAMEAVRDMMAEELGVESESYQRVDRQLSEEIPYKSVYPYFSDIRTGTIRGIKELEVEQVKNLLETSKQKLEDAGGSFSKGVVDALEVLNEEYTQIPAYGLNMYVVGGTQELGSKIYTSAEEAVAGIKGSKEE